MNAPLIKSSVFVRRPQGLDMSDYIASIIDPPDAIILNANHFEDLAKLLSEVNCRFARCLGLDPKAEELEADFDCQYIILMKFVDYRSLCAFLIVDIEDLDHDMKDALVTLARTKVVRVVALWSGSKDSLVYDPYNEIFYDGKDILIRYLQDWVWKKDEAAERKHKTALVANFFKAIQKE